MTYFCYHFSYHLSGVKYLVLNFFSKSNWKMKWQCRRFGYALARFGHLSFIIEPSSLFILIFQKWSLLYSNSSANLPRKSSPHTPLCHRENPPRPLNVETHALRKTLSHFNLQTLPPIPNPSEATVPHTSEPTVPETSPENPSRSHRRKILTCNIFKFILQPKRNYDVTHQGDFA